MARRMWAPGRRMSSASLDADQSRIRRALRVDHRARGRSRRRRASTRTDGGSRLAPTGAPLTNQVERQLAAERLQAQRLARRRRDRPSRRRAERIFSAPRARSPRSSSARPCANAAAAAAIPPTVATRSNARRRRPMLDVAAEPREGVEQDRRCGLATNQARRRPIVGPPDPDGDGGLLVEADRQRVAEAVGGAGLEGDAAARARWPAAARRAKCPRHNRPPTASVTRRAGSSAGRAVEALVKRRRLAAARQTRIEPREVDQRNAEAAEADGEADRRVLGQRDGRSRAMQPRQKRGRADRRRAVRSPAG